MSVIAIPQHVLFDRGLTLPQIRVLISLFSGYRFGGPITTPVEEIARTTGYPPREVRAYLDQLIAKDWLQETRDGWVILLPGQLTEPGKTTRKTSKRFEPPTREEVAAYCRERGSIVEADQWYDHYTANGWRVGKNKMSDWKASVRTWERMRQANNRYAGSVATPVKRQRAADVALF